MLTELLFTRFRRELKKRRVVKGKTFGRLLPRVGDYSTRALLQPDCDMNPKATATCAANRTKRKGKKSWARKKIKTGRRLLLSLGVTLTAPTPDLDDETDKSSE